MAAKIKPIKAKPKLKPTGFDALGGSLPPPPTATEMAGMKKQGAYQAGANTRAAAKKPKYVAPKGGVQMGLKSRKRTAKQIESMY